MPASSVWALVIRAIRLYVLAVTGTEKVLVSEEPEGVRNELPGISYFTLTFSVPPSSANISTVISAIPFSSTARVFAARKSGILTESVTSLVAQQTPGQMTE